MCDISLYTPMWGSNSQPCDQESHTPLTEQPDHMNLLLSSLVVKKHCKGPRRPPDLEKWSLVTTVSVSSGMTGLSDLPVHIVWFHVLTRG